MLLNDCHHILLTFILALLHLSLGLSFSVFFISLIVNEMQFLNIFVFFPLSAAATATEKTATMITHENSELNVFENMKVFGEIFIN